MIIEIIKKLKSLKIKNKPENPFQTMTSQISLFKPIYFNSSLSQSIRVYSILVNLHWFKPTEVDSSQFELILIDLSRFEPIRSDSSRFKSIYFTIRSTNCSQHDPTTTKVNKNQRLKFRFITVLRVFDCETISFLTGTLYEDFYKVKF